jgi:formylglycine-generating enzyme
MKRFERSIVCMLWLLAILGSGYAHGATVYDAAADLTEASIDAGQNPNGPWSYGFRNTVASTAITLLGAHGSFPGFLPDTAEVKGWFDPQWMWLPQVVRNMTSVPISYQQGSITLAPGLLMLHPGDNLGDQRDDGYAVLRWTAPVSSELALTAVFTGADSNGTTTDVHVTKNGISLYDAEISGGLGAPANVRSYSDNLWVAEGDSIDFVVGPGSDLDFGADSTSLYATLSVVPEPSTLAFLGAAAIGLLGWAWRKRVRQVTSMSVVLLLASGVARADVFNMGGTQNPDGTWNGLASLEFVTVGDPGNAGEQSRLGTGDTTFYGSVGYTYQMGKYDVTTAQYCQFLNAVATTSDPYGLWNSYMATVYPNSFGVNLGIQRSGTAGSYSYSLIGTGNVPSFEVTWGSAARFCNWLQNAQPSGTGTIEGTGTTETGAYTLNGVTSFSDLMLVTRNTGATYVIPTENEWYKAAYYRGNGTAAGYWTYPTKSNTAPSNVLSGTGTNNANYSYADPPNKLTPVGAFAASPGPYGAYDQGGDVWQWNETNVSGYRGLRGGAFDVASVYLAASLRGNDPPTLENYSIGFRVAEVPEPGSIALLLAAALGVAGVALHRRRHRAKG